MPRPFSFIASLLAARTIARANRKAEQNRRGKQFLRSAMLDLLEERQLLATYYVDNFSDAIANSTASNGTLRWAISQANTNPGNDIINFSGSWPQTITLTAANGPLNVYDSSGGSLTINGPGQANLTISGGNVTGIFYIQTPTTIDNLSILY